MRNFFHAKSQPSAASGWYHRGRRHFHPRCPGPPCPQQPPEGALIQTGLGRPLALSMPGARRLVPEGALPVGAAIVVNILAKMEAAVSSGVRRWPGPGQKYPSVTVAVSRRHMNSTPGTSKTLMGPRLRTDGPDTKRSVQSQRAGHWEVGEAPLFGLLEASRATSGSPACRMYRAAPCVCIFI